MEVKTDHAKKAGDLFLSGCSCSQAILCAFEDVTGLDQGTAMRLASSFGGGMGRMREVCGSVSASLMVLGLLYGYETPGDYEAKKLHYALVQEFAKRFMERRGSIVCRDILKGIATDDSPIPSERNEEYYKKRPCLFVIEDAAYILEEMIKEIG